MKIPADAIAGTKHVVGVVPLNVDTDDAKDNTDSLLLRFSDDEQVSCADRMLCMALQTPASTTDVSSHSHRVAASCHRSNTV